MSLTEDSGSDSGEDTLQSTHLSQSLKLKTQSVSNQEIDVQTEVSQTVADNPSSNSAGTDPSWSENNSAKDMDLLQVVYGGGGSIGATAGSSTTAEPLIHKDMYTLAGLHNLHDDQANRVLEELEAKWMEDCQAYNEALQDVENANFRFKPVMEEEVCASMWGQGNAEGRGWRAANAGGLVAEESARLLWGGRKCGRGYVTGCGGGFVTVMAGGAQFIRRVLNENAIMPSWEEWEHILGDLNVAEERFEVLFCDEGLESIMGAIDDLKLLVMAHETREWFLE